MPCCGIFDWDMELGKPHRPEEVDVRLPLRVYSYEDWEQNIRRVIDHNVYRWMERYIETMPYWGA